MPHFDPQKSSVHHQLPIIIYTKDVITRDNNDLVSSDQLAAAAPSTEMTSINNSIEEEVETDIPVNTSTKYKY